MHGSAPWKTEETIVGLPRLLVLSVLLTSKVLFFEQDCQAGQDCRARNRFVLRNRSSLPVWLRPIGRAVFSRSDSPDLVAPGRPGWSPTQAPHKSVLAQLTHTAPRFNLRDPLSVVVSWTRPQVPMQPPCFPPTVS